MGCAQSKTSDPSPIAPHGNHTGNGNHNGVDSGENGTDNKLGDTDSVAEFRARVKEAKTMDDIFHENQCAAHGTRDSLTGDLSLYNNPVHKAKKRESISDIIIRKFFIIHVHIIF